MDDIVKAAMAKWPKVPHCYAWLALDARGNWRMRDERAQALNLAGDTIRNPALQQFINRNYGVDDEGRWYFQNGPQKVYVDLEATPYISQLLPNQVWRLHTGEILDTLEKAHLLQDGSMTIQNGEQLAQVDDRDLVDVIALLRLNSDSIPDDQLWQIIETGHCDGALALQWHNNLIPVQLTTLARLMQENGFQSKPR
ncbi:DUF2946 family protein [Undibacterium sp. LX40W]|uniref:DUF2946 family protein n=1 Tax=Undibacterium nitidum TaxID=2762298 RepID=A0A923KT17_9BURK|nr:MULTISPECIES: DUF2946 family protein [Undibacterium]MBC3880832.1 DUF2946 family protein [Undibacterium nitidum]MBC3890435.1 DUF2946 family protein [Undibacterium sp. LX40W]